MSSWSGSRSYATKKLTVPQYAEMNYTANIFSSLLEFLGSHIYSQKMGERLHIYDQIGLLNLMYRPNPQVNFLKEIPEDTPKISTSGIRTTVAPLKFVDVQKYAATLFEYKPDFNQSVIDVLVRNNIKGLFDIGVHLVPDASGSFAHIIPLVQAYQKKSKKQNLNIFIMAETVAQVNDFLKMGDPSWRASHLLRVSPKTADEAFLFQMAQVQIMSAQPALVLDFDQPIDKYIYLMHRTVKDIVYFKTSTPTQWTLV